MDYNPSKIKASYKKFYQIRKMICRSFSEKFYYDMQFELIAQALQNGDTQPAVVVSRKPLIISAYSDEFDAVVFLHFPDELADVYGLSENTRLAVSDIYLGGGGKTADDIKPGERSTGNFYDFIPVVQLFFGKDDEKIKKNADIFDDALWERVGEKTKEYAALGKERNGFFYCFKNK
ncbi:MAG: hypothetical protein II135_07765 [Clostridia bacterium]|nr:hypothetical protein [Clostridia bacterium]